MKTNKNTFNSLTSYLGYILLSAALFSCSQPEIEPQIGDVWRYRPITSNNNPFTETTTLKKYYDYKIIDIKDGYVLFYDLIDSTKESSTIKMFKFNAERICGCR